VSYEKAACSSSRVGRYKPRHDAESARRTKRQQIVSNNVGGKVTTGGQISGGMIVIDWCGTEAAVFERCVGRVKTEMHSDD
jgi:hypothetical protein